MTTIKFHLLAIGQTFESHGGHYTKVSPLVASNNADGKQKMVPRSALVRVQGNLPEKSHPAPSPLLQVVERYHQSVLAELQSLCDDEEKVGAARARLTTLKTELINALKQP